MNFHFHTNSKIATRSFEWTFKNVTRESIEKHDINNRIVSKPFKIKLGENSSEWSFYTYFCKNAQGLKFRLVKNKSTCTNFRTSFSLQLNDFVRDDVTSMPLKVFGWLCFMKTDELFDLSRKYIDENGCLKFIAKIKLTEIDGEAGCKDDVESKNSVMLYDSFSDYIDDRKYSDFILICSDHVEIHVHRLILAKKSQIFAKMFEIEMFEKRESKALIGDINSKTMNAVLRWMYTGKTSQYDVKLATSVLYAAEKYQLFDLKCHCVNELLRQIDKNNALDILRTADLYYEAGLEEKSMCIILLHYEDIKKSKKWKQIKMPLLMKILDAAHSEASHWAFETVL